MLYFSHLLADSDMKDVICQTGMGIESIEFSISDNLDHLDRTLSEYEKRLDYMECKNLILHGPFLDLNPMAFDSEIRRVTFERYNAAYQAAKKLHATKLVFHSCFLPQIYMTIGLAQRIVDFYERFLDNKDDSIQILVENVLDFSPETISEAAQKIKHPAFGLCLDIGHANCYSTEPLKQWIKCMHPNIRHAHLHNNDGRTDSHSALDSGIISAKDILCQLKKEPSLDTFTIECSNKQAVIDSWKICRQYL